MNTCPECSSVISDGVDVCPECGFSLAEDIAETLLKFGLDENRTTRFLADGAMTPEKWQKIKILFLAAREIAPEKRENFLKNACEGEIKSEVESLLDSLEKNKDFLENPPVSEMADVLEKNRANGGRQDKSYSPGTIIDGHYEIIRLLGKGGMGEVFLARDTKLDRQIALKILPADFAGDDERMHRFVQEAKAASALNHPNILTIYEIGASGDIHFIATEYIAGLTLNEYLKNKSLKFKAALDIAAQVSSALAAAHEAGIIHRDIKPDNVMIRNDGIVKVLDFGLAKLIRLGNADVGLGIGENETLVQSSEKIPNSQFPIPNSPVTKPGMILGTPQYMSPEQARGQKVDSRTDIFSFGIVLYEMIAGRPPFSGENQFDTISAILKEEPKPLKEYVPQIPEDLEHLVGKALRKDREQRYQSIKDLYIDLNDIKNSIVTDLKFVADTNRSLPPRQTLKTGSSIVTERRYSLVHALILLMVFIAAAGTLWWLTASSGTRIESQLKTQEIFNWTSQPGEFYSAGTFSPDAKMVAFVSTKAGSKGIWVKQTNSGEAVQITKDAVDYRSPVWSPDGEELAFYSTRGGSAGFWRIPALGGSPKLIKAIDDGSSRLLFWPANNRIYYESERSIYAVDMDSGETKQITNPASEAVNGQSLNLSPDEKNIVYITAENNRWNLWTAGINGENPKSLFGSETEIRNTVWHPDNKRLFFSRMVDGVFQIFVTEISEVGQPQQLTFFEQDGFVRDVSSDGSKILYGWAKEESDVWGVKIADSREFNVASEIDSELWADVSPDGKTLVYQSIKNLSQGNKLFSGKILAKSLETGGDPSELAPSGFLPKWSPDGLAVAFITLSGDQYRLETIRPAGGEKKTLAAGVYPVSFSILPYNRVQISDFRWSPDAGKIIYVSKKSGPSSIWQVNADGSNDTLLIQNDEADLNLACPLWSADGKRIAFTTKTMNSTGKPFYSVRVFDTETKETKILQNRNIFLRLIGWAADGGGLILASVENTQTTALRSAVTLFQINIETGKIQEIAKLPDTYQYNIHLSPDGKRIAFVAHREDTDNIWIIPAAGGDAKKITGNNDSRLYFSTLAWSPANDSIFFGKQLRYSLLSMLTNFQ